MLSKSEQLVTLFDQVFATRPRKEWLKVFAEYDLPAAPVNRLCEPVDDPQIMENGYITDFDHPRLGKIRIPGYPVHFSKADAKTKAAAPELGEHTDSILRQVGGYSDEQIARFRHEGVV